MEQKFLLKEIERQLADVESVIADMRSKLDILLQQAEVETAHADVNMVAQKQAEAASPRVDGRLIKDLRKAIGLNDSIMFCRELFGGDRNLMETTIGYLNDASSYMEALEYLAENFNWDNENETVKYFKDLLSRKAY